MTSIFVLLAALLSAALRLLRPGGVRGLVAENLLLKHQLIILNRPRRRAPSLLRIDRLLLGLGSLMLHRSRLSKVATAVRPVTILSFHRALVRRKYRALFSSRKTCRPGPKGPSASLIRAIVELKKRNPRFGSPRIARIISTTFGVEIDKDVVRRVLAGHYRPNAGGPGPSWLTFLGHTKNSLWSLDLFRCESIKLETHWVLVVLDQYTRRIIGFGVHRGAVDGRALCRMFNTAVAGHGTAKRLSTDHDPLFESHRWKTTLSVLEIEEIKTVPFVPRSHPFVERLIGTVRRELLDLVLFWGQLGLERKLAGFRRYYSAERVRSSLDGMTPDGLAGSAASKRVSIDDFAWKSTCEGLVELPRAA